MTLSHPADRLPRFHPRRLAIGPTETEHSSLDRGAAERRCCTDSYLGEERGLLQKTDSYSVEIQPGLLLLKRGRLHQEGFVYREERYLRRGVRQWLLTANHGDGDKEDLEQRQSDDTRRHKALRLRIRKLACDGRMGLIHFG